MRRLAWFSVGFGAACLLACYAGSGPLSIGLSAALLLLFLILWRASRPKPNDPPILLRKPKLHSRQTLYHISRRALALCLGGLLALGWFSAYSALFYVPSANWIGDGTQLSGTVISYPRETSIGGRSVTVALDGDFAAPDVLIYGDENWGVLEPGDHITCTARTMTATRMRGDDTTYYTAKGVYLLAYCNGLPEVEKANFVPIRCWPTVCAHMLKAGIYAAFDEVAAPMAVAVTLGDKSGLPDLLYSALSRSGLMHAAAVSGLHISFLVGAIMLLTGRNRKVALALVPVLLFYALMAGGTPSALRAVIMQTALLAAPVTKRDSDSPSALGLALLILLVQNPFAAASVSLQLSFASVAGILLVTGPLSKRLLDRTKRFRRAHREGMWKPLWAAYTFVIANVSTSLGAMLFTVPLIVLYFGQILLISPVANVLTLWALTLLMMTALLIGTLAVFFPGPAAVLGAVCGLAAHYVRWVVLWLGKFPFASLSADNPYCLIWLGAVYLVLLIFRLSKAQRPRPLVPVISLAVLLVAAIGLGRLSVFTADLTVAALDVGQGASTALLSGNRTALVDCGGNQSSSAGDIAADYFASLGRVRLDLLALTHLDDDHFNGVEQLFYRMDVRQIAVPSSADPDKLALLLDWAEIEGAEVIFIDEITEYAFGNSTLTLFPPLSGGTSNESGLFALCSAGEFDALITGDADSFVEKMLVKYYPIPDIELLMVGHHGSHNSTCAEFLDTALPELAVISVGWNSYGHPRQEALDRLEAIGSQVHRTDTEGTVTVTVRGEHVNIY